MAILIQGDYCAYNIVLYYVHKYWRTSKICPDPRGCSGSRHLEPCTGTSVVVAHQCGYPDNGPAAVSPPSGMPQFPSRWWGGHPKVTLGRQNATLPLHYWYMVHPLLQVDEGLPHVDCKQWCTMVTVAEDPADIIVLKQSKMTSIWGS